MNIAEPFILRPVMTTLVMAATLVFGVMAYRQLPTSDLPTIEAPTLSVSAELPGASPETMAASVATPLEREFSTIAGLETMTSSSTLGRCDIAIQFKLDRDIDGAALDVQAAISRTAGRLPSGMPNPPTFRKVNPAEQPIMFLALRSRTQPAYVLDEYAQTTMAQRLSTISGVAQVTVNGSQKYAVRVRLDPRALAARGLGIDEVADAISHQNSKLPIGTLWGPETSYTLESTGQLQRAVEYRPMIVAYRNGHPVRLRDLGDVIDGVETDKTAAWFNGERSISLAIEKQPGANTVEVVERIREMLPVLLRQLPPSIDIAVSFDRSEGIREAVHDVKFTLYLTLVLVVLTIFLFLRNLSATVIPSLAIPMSLIGTFAVMYALGFSLNNLSLMALTLSIGFVVDDAIVMLENIVRHMEHGEPRWKAALRGSREVGFTIISMTISLAAVFIPVMFMEGIVGRLLNEFAITIGAAILISGVVSLTLTPMLCSRFLRPPAREHGVIYRAIEWVFDAMLAVYEWTLKLTLKMKLATMLMSAVILWATVHLFTIMPKGFLPNEDTGRIFITTQAQEGIGFPALIRAQQEVVRRIEDEPAVENILSNVGQRGSRGAANEGFVFITLKPRDQRRESVDEMIQRLRTKLGDVPGMRTFIQNPPPIRFTGSISKNQYQVVLQGDGFQQLFKNAQVLVQQLRNVEGIQDATTDVQVRNPQVKVTIDRDKASILGVTAQQVERALSLAYGTRQISTILAPDNQYAVIVELDPSFQTSPDSLSMLYVRSANDKLVPLDTVVTVERTVGPLAVTHLGQLPSVSVSFNLRPGFALGNAVEHVNAIAREHLPANITTSFLGTAQIFQDSLRGLGVLLIVTILVIYIVLGILYESFIHPLTILTGLPFAGFGALVTLMLFDMDLNLYAFVGVIMLVGLVKKNSIMIVDFAIEAQRHGETSPEKAVYEACVVRFRPIMMTTFAALLGTLPIAVGYGAGAESRQPLGLAVVGGLLFSQILTLYVTPVFYLYMEKLQRLLRRGQKPPQADEPSTPLPPPAHRPDETDELPAYTHA